MPAALGMLDGRRTSSHSAHCTRLTLEHPHIMVAPDALFTEVGPSVTGAEISPGTDLALAMVENDYSTDAARQVARWMVVFLQPPGGQAQFEGPRPGRPPRAACARSWTPSSSNPPRCSATSGALRRPRYAEHTRLEAAKLSW
ncbi:hypothetical protein [Streptomyces sp. NPDC017435]|uniref:hypothetical protein n=1 Tax=Streptomyces sp. NPDC017435 TaxID=3364995 RepID=UPI0037B9C4FD